MKSTRNRSHSLKSAEEIAQRADRGGDVSQFFTNRGKMMPSVQRVNVDFASPMLEELDKAANDLNVSRQAVIKTLLRQGLDQHYLAQSASELRVRMTVPHKSRTRKTR